MSTGALRDVFMWSLRCVAEGKISTLEEARMILFHDVSRVQEIREACLVLGLRILRSECDEILRRWESIEDAKISAEADVCLGGNGLEGMRHASNSSVGDVADESIGWNVSEQHEMSSQGTVKDADIDPVMHGV